MLMSTAFLLAGVVLILVGLMCLTIWKIVELTNEYPWIPTVIGILNIFVALTFAIWVTGNYW